jgi:integrase
MNIVPYNQPDRPKPFGVKWRDEDGKRRFKFFATEKERDKYAADLSKKTRREGDAVLALSASDAVTMQKCLGLLGDAPTVLLACQEYAGKRKIHTITPADAITEYQREKSMMGRDENYQRAKRMHFERLAAFMPASLEEWTPDKARTWAMMLNADFSPVTVKNHVRTAITFSRWAVERHYLRENPFAAVPVPDVIRPEPEVMAVEDVRAFLAAAVEHYPEAVAYAALSLFAGLRSSVCARLGMEAYNFKERGILIPALAAKNKRRIYTDGHPANLWAWLRWAKKHAPDGFTLSKRMWDRRREQIRELAGLTMPHNAFRHSFCTYHVALLGDAGRTATLLTHRGNVSLLYEHYRGNATRAAGEAYFGIMPPASSCTPRQAAPSCSRKSRNA